MRVQDDLFKSSHLNIFETVDNTILMNINNYGVEKVFISDESGFN